MLSKESLKINKLKIFSSFILYTLPVLFLTNFFYSYIIELQTNIIIDKAKYRQQEVVNTAVFQMESIFSNIYNDLILVSNSDEINTYLQEPSANNKNEAEKMFSRVLDSRPEIAQLRLLSLSGGEKIRVNQKDEDITIVDESLLQDKSNRYYYKSVLKLEKSQMYISDFDLNIENGEYTVPYEPVVRMGMPVFFNDEPMGFLLFNYDGMALLKFIDEYESQKTESINLGILDRNHLVSLNVLDSYNTLEESFLTEINKENSEYYDLYQKVKVNNSGSFSVNSKVFFYKQLSADSWIFDAVSNNWIIISSFEENKIIDETENFLINRIMILRVVLLAFIAVIILIAVTLSSIKHNDDLLLLARGYISDFTNDSVLITDHNKKVLYCNKAFEQTFGYSFDSIEGKNPGDFLGGLSSIEFDKKNNGKNIWEGNIWDTTSAKTIILKYLRIKAVYSYRKNIVYFVGLYSEPRTDLFRHENNQVVNHQLIIPDIDFLTSTFKKKFEQIEQKAMIIIRLNEFNLIRSYITDQDDNEIISSLFQEIISIGGLVIIPGSGLIFIVAPIIQSESFLHSLMESIDASLSSIRFAIKTNIPVNYSAGVAISRKLEQDCTELMDNALIALEALVKTKDSKYLVYNQNIYDLVKKDKIIRDELENAFRNNEFNTVYQLQQNAVTLEYTGAEVFVRWNSPKIGQIPPDVFIPVLERSNYIIMLCKYVLNIATNEFKDFMSELPPDFHISINLSPLEFNNSEVISDLITIIDKSGIPRSSFCFEITEKTIVENINFTNIITQKLQSQDITVAIDDFGIGFSSLSYLKKIEADKIKIDRMFIKDYPHSDNGRIFESVINMVKETNKKIIIEGVETQAQLELIRELGCDEFQGYLFSEPSDINKIKKLIRKTHTDDIEN